METNSYDKIVDSVIDNLSSSFVESLDNNYRPDFSSLRNQLLAVIKSGKIENIEGIIGSFYVQEMRKYDRKIQGIIDHTKGKEARDYLAKRHSKVWDKLIENGKRSAVRCAQYIINEKNELIPSKKENSSFKDSIKDFNGSQEQSEIISTEEALQKSAQSVYDKTGNVPNGYILNENGKIIRDTTEHVDSQPNITSINETEKDER